MSKKTKITVISAVALALVIALAAGAYFFTRPETNEGAKTITFTVIDKEKVEKPFTIETDEKYLANALANEGVITYDQGGFYTEIDGITADYNVDGGWWAIYENGTMASVGMNELAIADGGKYEAVYTIGFAS